MQYPKITIITPSYNQGEFIEETILSVINQNYPNLEYIIIDGGSKDNSVEIIKKYEQYLTYWVSESDSGMYHAIQKGFEKSSGDIMGWINSDDKLSENSISIISDIFTRYSQVEWLGGCSVHISEKSNIVNILPQRKWNKYMYHLLEYKYLQQEGTFWRRNLWDKSGSSLKTNAQYAGDLELWLRFFHITDYYTLDIPIGLFRVRGSNQKSLENIDTYNAEAELFIKAYPLNDHEKTQLKKYWFHKKVIQKIPVLRGLPYFNKSYLELDIFKFPKGFYFDNFKQTIILEE